jgi:hypothetical protein
MAQYSVTASAGLYVRNSPDSSNASNIVGKAAREARVDALEFNADKTWLRGTVSTDRGVKTGWLSMRWLQLIPDAPAVTPPVPPPPVVTPPPTVAPPVVTVTTPVPPKPLTWRMGVNMREFAYYGTPFMPPTADGGLRDRQLGVAQSLGVQTIRFWASHHRFSTADSIAQIRMALDSIRRFKMQAVICLEDSLTGAGLYIPGDDAFHTGPLGHFVMSYWIQERYRINYLPHVEKIVTAFKDDPAVLMWELGNEFALHPQPAPELKAAAAFRQFAAVVSKRIKEISPSHLVGTGLVHHNHVHSPFESRRDAARQLYSIPTLDAVSLHYYHHDAQYDEMRVDIEVAKSLNKPIYVGEVGMEVNTGDRPAYLDGQIKEKRREGAFMVMPWNLDSSEWDANIGDIYAFSRRHGDFDPVLNVIRANAT